VLTTGRCWSIAIFRTWWATEQIVTGAGYRTKHYRDRVVGDITNLRPRRPLRTADAAVLELGSHCL
jgi:hypothetical protein